VSFIITDFNVFVQFCLAKKLFHVCFTLKIINCNEFHSDFISLFEKLDKNIEIGNNEDKTRTRWNDFLFLITDDRDFRPQTCTNGLVFRECKHIKNIKNIEIGNNE
jgi:hypothetical protein